MIQIAHNAVNAALVGADKEAKLEVHRLLSYRVEGADHMQAFKSHQWDGRSSFFSFDKGTFPAGFVHLVSRGLAAKGYKVQIKGAEVPPPLGPERPEVDEFGYDPLYDYQPAAVDALVRHKKIIAQVATGGGKSRIARMALARINRPSLFLTTRGILMYQMHAEIEKMTGSACAILGDGEWGIPYKREDGTEGRKISRFVVGMVQTLAARLEKKTVKDELAALEERRKAERARLLAAEDKKLRADKSVSVVDRGTRLLELGLAYDEKQGPIEDQRPAVTEKVARHEKLRQATLDILARFELVIVEEAHEVSGDSFYAVMSACRNAHYRMALTATPFMKDDEEANMRLLASCGPVAVKITEKLLIDRGILAKPYFKFVAMPADKKPKALFRSTPWQRAYEVGIVKNEFRNKAICAEVLRARIYGMNAMVLVQHKEHGKLLMEMMEARGLRVKFIYGENNQKARKAALAELGSGALDVLIGSTILDVGVDVPSVGMIVKAGGGKAEVADRQRTGRGLRKKKRGPNAAFVVDFADDHNTYLKEHMLQRRAIIESTPGFAENIVADFNFAGIGFTKVPAA